MLLSILSYSKRQLLNECKFKSSLINIQILMTMQTMQRIFLILRVLFPVVICEMLK